MKRWRVLVSGGVVAAVLVFVCFVPVPISRVRAVGLVQPHPAALSQVVVRRGGYLLRLRAQPGDAVTKGAVLAEFRDPELEDQLAGARTELENARENVRLLRGQKEQPPPDHREVRRLHNELATAEGKERVARAKVKSLEEVQAKELVLLAPRDGVVGQAPRVDDVGKYFEAAREQSQAPPLFTVIEPGRLRVCLPVVTTEFNQLRENLYPRKIARRASRGDRPTEELGVTIRVHGRDSSTWTGRVARLEEAEAKSVPLPLSSRGGGPVAVKASAGKSGALVPQTQHYLVYLDILEPDAAIAPGSMAQVKIHCKPETCLRWLWRTVNNTFDLRLM